MEILEVVAMRPRYHLCTNAAIRKAPRITSAKGRKGVEPPSALQWPWNPKRTLNLLIALIAYELTSTLLSFAIARATC